MKEQDQFPTLEGQFVWSKDATSTMLSKTEDKPMLCHGNSSVNVSCSLSSQVKNNELAKKFSDF